MRDTKNIEYVIFSVWLNMKREELKMIFRFPGKMVSHIPGSSADKESTCNAGDPDLTPESGRSTGEGIGYQLQHSGASLVAQTVKNPPAMWDTWVQFLGWENPWRREQLPTPVFLPGESHGQRSLDNYSPWGPWGHKESDMSEWLTFRFLIRELDASYHCVLKEGTEQ